MTSPAAQPEPQEHDKPGRTVSAWWMVLGAVVLAIAGLAAWVVVDVLPESRWMARHSPARVVAASGAVMYYAPVAKVVTTGAGGSTITTMVWPKGAMVIEEPIGPRWLTDRMPAWYARHMSRLISISIAGGGWTEQELDSLAHFEDLQLVNLLGSDTSALPSLPQVLTLDLTKTPVEGLERFPNVRALYIQGPALDERAAAVIRGLRHLKELKVPRTTEQRIIDEIKASMPGLTIEQ